MPVGIASICNAAARPYRADSADPISVIQWTETCAVAAEPSTVMSLAEVEAFAMRVVRANGLADHQAVPIARATAVAEASDCRSHGLYRLIGYVGSIRSGRVSAVAAPRLERIAGSFLRVDGQNGFAPAAHAIGVPALIEAAQNNGIAALALTNWYHYSALWHAVDGKALVPPERADRRDEEHRLHYVTGLVWPADHRGRIDDAAGESRSDDRFVDHRVADSHGSADVQPRSSRKVDDAFAVNHS